MPTPLRILIVEDEPAIADTLLYALKTEGFAPEWCATGRAGLAALDVAGQQKLTEDFIGLMQQFDRGGDAGLVIPSDYLEIVITRK